MKAAKTILLVIEIIYEVAKLIIEKVKEEEEKDANN